MVAACVTIPAVAHRGGTERYAENSRNAFRDARNGGVQMWETDVRFTADNVPVIMHDTTIDRTTDGTGTIADLTYAQLRTFRTGDDQPVLVLAELINDARVDGAKVFVELKVQPTLAQWAALTAALASRPAMTSKVVLISFDGAVLIGARTNAPAYSRGLIGELGDQSAASVAQYGAAILIKHHNAITKSRLANWSAGGLAVYAWTVDTESEWARMSSYPQLDGAITNLPHGYLTWQKTHAC